MSACSTSQLTFRHHVNLSRDGWKGVYKAIVSARVFDRVPHCIEDRAMFRAPILRAPSDKRCFVSHDLKLSRGEEVEAPDLDRLLLMNVDVLTVRNSSRRVKFNR